MSGIPILHINHRKKFITFRLEGLQVDGDEPIWPQYSQAISDALIGELQQHASTLLRSATRSGLYADMTDLGLLLYDNLVPEGIREILRNYTGPLFVWTEISNIPWEQLYDGEEFWGNRYAMGRRIITSVSHRPRISGGVNKVPSVLVITSNPNGDLAWLEDEVETVVSTISQFADISVLSGSRATMIETIRELRKGCYTIIHYCGHATNEPSTGEGALLLHDGQLLTASTIKSNLRGAPVVFLNACQSARGGSETGVTAVWDGVTASLSDAFLLGGAAGVIGTVADVGDKEGAQFASVFYQHLNGGVELGKAIQLTRMAFCSEVPDNPVWSSFVLFGSPGGAPGTPVVVSQSTVKDGSYPDLSSPLEDHQAGRAVVPLKRDTPDVLDVPGHRDSWQEVLGQVKPAILYVETDRGGGTGFLIGDGEYAVTCNHVVRNSRNIHVRYIDGRQVAATILGVDRNSDLAILKLEEASVVASLSIAEADAIQEGQSILAIGHPLGFSFTVSRGIVSSRCRVIDAIAYIQTDASLNPGNSGGPIICESGEVVGIVSFGVGGGAQGLGFGVAPPHLRSLMTRLRIRSATQR